MTTLPRRVSSSSATAHLGVIQLSITTLILVYAVDFVCFAPV
jgi:hypothetical protein